MLWASGLDPNHLPRDLGEEGASRLYGTGGSQPRRWEEIWSAGHSVSGVRAMQSVEEIVTQTYHEYCAAQ